MLTWAVWTKSVSSHIGIQLWLRARLLLSWSLLIGSCRPSVFRSLLACVHHFSFFSVLVFCHRVDKQPLIKLSLARLRMSWREAPLGLCSCAIAHMCPEARATQKRHVRIGSWGRGAGAATDRPLFVALLWMRSPQNIKTSPQWPLGSKTKLGWRFYFSFLFFFFPLQGFLATCYRGLFCVHACVRARTCVCACISDFLDNSEQKGGWGFEWWPFIMREVQDSLWLYKVSGDVCWDFLRNFPSQAFPLFGSWLDALPLPGSQRAVVLPKWWRSLLKRCRHKTVIAEHVGDEERRWKTTHRRCLVREAKQWLCNVALQLSADFPKRFARTAVVYMSAGSGRHLLPNRFSDCRPLRFIHSTKRFPLEKTSFHVRLCCIFSPWSPPVLLWCDGESHCERVKRNCDLQPFPLNSVKRINHKSAVPAPICCREWLFNFYLKLLLKKKKKFPLLLRPSIMHHSHLKGTLYITSVDASMQIKCYQSIRLKTTSRERKNYSEIFDFLFNSSVFIISFAIASLAKFPMETQLLW